MASNELISNPTFKATNNNATSTVDDVLSIEKRINTTTAVVGDIIVIEIILHNYRSADIYNVTVTEDTLLNPLVNTTNLVSPITFAKLNAFEETIIAYTLTAYKPINFTISSTVANYQIKENDARIFTAYSVPFQMSFVARDLSKIDLTKEYTLIYTFLIGTYTIVLFIRIFFKSRRTKVPETT